MVSVVSFNLGHSDCTSVLDIVTLSVGSDCCKVQWVFVCVCAQLQRNVRNANIQCLFIAFTAVDRSGRSQRGGHRGHARVNITPIHHLHPSGV